MNQIERQEKIINTITAKLKLNVDAIPECILKGFMNGKDAKYISLTHNVSLGKVYNYAKVLKQYNEHLELINNTTYDYKSPVKIMNCGLVNQLKTISNKVFENQSSFTVKLLPNYAMELQNILTFHMNETDASVFFSTRAGMNCTASVPTIKIIKWSESL